ncbi:ubiquitin-like domain-containing protein [Nocardia fluminea]|uniref:Ubiquitin domain-containing protein n=1 Tax=Nocardia fluminea TaxID=134984 RepID=A0A2N3VJ85_9NOCA|nr:ubiquitin-like domain-containing protein [Nocardia fluminea]PKV81673.1 ubiquitin domain-containing protein [Nocardia fluminea]
MRVQHHAQHTLGTRLRRGVTVGLIAAAMTVPVAGIASAQPAPPAPPAAPAAPIAPAAPVAPAAPIAPEVPAVPGAPGLPATPGLPGLPGAPLAESATSITLTVNGVDGESIPVSIDSTATVQDLKGLIQEQTGVPAAEQQLVTASDVELVDSETLASYELADGDIVTLAVA